MINDPERFLAGFWNWDFLIPAFDGTKIRVSDIDGMIERNGEFLFIETKSRTCKGLSLGQKIAYKNLQKKGITIFVVFGDTNKAERLQIFSRKFPEGSNICKCDNERLLKGVKLWFNWANDRTTNTK